ncbi:MAG: tRNA (adenosine(37)-N6)-threonylcarbamoyltransferase complex dimerization subunit type 1 TsaB [Bacteroidales bacterium]|nr:tRNA (adenosine(37)-N6)-threonylcarbamoyltransferase complex dimerization subunit type 1 TsaB [Bacteroidales bacterium]
MSLILNIETATQVCSVGLSDGKHLLALRESYEKNIHAAKVTVFCEEVIRESGKSMTDINAIAVSKGPGSYTGLRIGISAAKGLCYALDIPLIAVPTLQSMALGALRSVEDAKEPPATPLYCPMIDARRMEVYTALFDQHNNEVRATEALIVDEESFRKEIKSSVIYYFGDGAEKCRDVLDHENMIYLDDIHPSATSLAVLANAKFLSGDFEDLAYFEPYYLKDFVAGKPKVKGLR